jgi:perosamine synthetase
LNHQDQKMIPIAKPMIGEEEIQAVTAVLQSGLLAQGNKVKNFEEDFADYLEVEHAVAVGNGTIALDLALKALGIRPGDEVIVPDFSFISTANSILFQGARPVFADIDERTFTIDPNDALEKITGRTKAILGVHLFGHPFAIAALEEICEDHSLPLIEDCAQAHGAEYRGQRVGSFGRIGCFSFYATKNMTTGEGGMITTDSAKLAEACRLLRNHGESEKYFHTSLGYNYRMTELQAALGVVQLKKLARFNRRRIANAKHYTKHINAAGLNHPYKKREVTHVYHQYAVTINEDGGFVLSRDEFMQYLKDKGIGCAIHYPLPIHRQPLYERLGYTDETVRCPVAREVSHKIVSLPVHPALSKTDLRYITETIRNLGGD